MLLKLALISVYGTREPERSMHERTLYRLLGERRPEYNISHKVMPTYNNHVKFVRSRPYEEWYVIYSENRPVGTAYITSKGEIGIFIQQDCQGMGLGRKTIEAIMGVHPKKTYYANISPKNPRSKAFFEKLGFIHHHTLWEQYKNPGAIIQHVYFKHVSVDALQNAP